MTDPSDLTFDQEQYARDGIADLEAYLAKHAAFADYCKSAKSRPDKSSNGCPGWNLNGGPS